MKSAIFFFFLVCEASQVVFPPAEYYWREYTGVIPSDALPVGKGIEKYTTFIGQAYIHTRGFFVAQIFPGTLEVSVPSYGVQKTKSDVKILCTEHPENFAWVATDNKHFHLDMTGEYPISGGYDFVDASKGVINIGRVMFEGILKIGMISSYTLEDAKLHVVHNNVERKTNLYQVLVYRNGSERPTAIIAD